MRRNVVAALGTLSSVVLLLAYPTSHNGTVSGNPQAVSVPAASSDTGTGTGTGTGSASGSASSGGSSSGSSSSGNASSGNSGATTYTGSEAQTRWGIVQVQITVQNGKITSSKALQYPNDNGHDQEINARALPILNAEVVKAQNASIDAVSGATVTSDGYVSSLQSALDAAKL